MKKFLSIFLASVLIVLMFVSCNKDTSDQSQNSLPANDSGSDLPSDSTTEETDKEIKLSENGTANFIILYPEGNDSLSQLASKLQMEIMKSTNIYVSCKKDTAVEYDENAIEILIGNTNRPESKSAFDRLMGPSDYICELIGNKITITGKNLNAVTSAYSYFVSKAIIGATADADMIYNNKNDIYFEGRNGCPIKTCAGNPLEEYRIVYPKDSIKGEFYTAASLKHHLYYKVGLDLELSDDSVPVTGKEILVGQTNRGITPTVQEGKFEVSVVDGNLCISAADAYGYEEAFKYLSKDLFIRKTDANTLTEDFVINANSKSVPKNNSEYRIMFNNCWGLGDNVEFFIENRDENAAAMYLAFDADVIGLNEYWPAMRESGAINALLEKNGYKEVAVSTNRPHGNVMPVFYKESSVKVIYATYTHYQWYLDDAAYEKNQLTPADHSKGVTTVVFESLKTGERFIVCNTHLSSNWNVSYHVGTINRKLHINTAIGEINKVLAKYPDLPVFLGCDYNATVSSEECKLLFDAKFKDCHAEATTVRGTDAASCHDAPTYSSELKLFVAVSNNVGSYSSSIDHIFLFDQKEQVKVDVYETVLTDLAASFSDHAPVVVEFNLNQK